MEQKSNGSLIGAVVIIVLLLIAGFFFWKNSVKNKVIEQPAISETSTSADVASDVSGLEQDLNSLDLDNLDTDL